MWEFFLEMNNSRYVSVIADWDTDTIKAIKKSKPYPGKRVRKLECINHVSKRIAKGIRTLVETKKKYRKLLWVGGVRVD